VYNIESHIHSLERSPDFGMGFVYYPPGGHMALVFDSFG
jgi:hypothetical protein